jgi:hypothetical protein
MSLDTELSDFNWHFLSQYGRIKFYVAARFWDAMTFDKAPIDPYRLACEFYARHGFNVEAKDPYVEGNRVRYKLVDDLVKENPEKLSDVGQMLYDGWIGFKKKLDAQRSKEPKLPTIPPPNPEPPPVVVEEPKKLPEVPVPKEPKKNPAPGLVKFSVYFGMIATAAGAAAFFFPQAKPIVAIVVALVQSILKYFGV